MHQIGAGLGVSLIPSDATGPEQTLRKADLALYRAKEERRSAVHFFEEGMDRRVQERQWLVQELRLALAQGDVCASFQPTVQLVTKKLVGFEASPRWLHATLGEIAPGRFIPIAEESGLIHELSDQILRQACTTAASWPQDVVLSIDVLSTQLKDKDLKTRILGILRETGLPPERLEIEITESTLVRNLEAAQNGQDKDRPRLHSWHALRARGRRDRPGPGRPRARSRYDDRRGRHRGLGATSFADQGRMRTGSRSILL
jgi:predicted signal transduction protein with EAL and GGDEF domain